MSTKPESIIEPKEMTPEPQEEEKEVKKEEIGESSIEKVAEIANPESEPIQVKGFSCSCFQIVSFLYESTIKSSQSLTIMTRKPSSRFWLSMMRKWKKLLNSSPLNQLSPP